MSDAELYLSELRRALPLGCRRRFVAEVRDHFESAVAAEAGHGVDRDEAERLTIERLGSADEVAGQLLADLRSGALGPAARLSAAVTATRIALAAVMALAVVVAVAVVSVRSTSPSKMPTAQPTTESPVLRNGVEVPRLLITLVNGVAKQHQFYARPAGTRPSRLRLTQQQWYKHPYGVTPVPVLTVTQTTR